MFYLILNFTLLLVLILLNFYLISLFISSFYGSPYVSTNKKIIDQILSKVHLKKNKLFFELGCGDGRVVKRAVEKYQVKGKGIDINPYLIIILKIINKFKKTNNPEFIFADIFKTNLTQANYIYCFLMPKMLDKLKEKFKKELKKGTIVISHGFKIPLWDKKLIFTLKGNKFNTYYYRI